MANGNLLGGLGDVLKDIEEKRQTKQGDALAIAQQESDALESLLQGISGAQPADVPLVDQAIPMERPAEPQVAEIPLPRPNEALRAPAMSLTSQQSQPEAVSNVDSKPSESPSKPSRPSTPSQGMGKYDKRIRDLLKEREIAVEEEQKKERLGDFLGSLDRSFARYDLSGGPQFAGLSPAEAKGIKFGDVKGVSDKFDRRLATEQQLQGRADRQRAAEQKALAAQLKAQQSGVKLTEAQKAVDKSFGKEYADYVAAGGFASQQKNLDVLRDVTDRLRKGDFETGALYEKLLPEGVATTTRALTDEGAQDAKDLVEQVIQQSLRQTLGAQFTEKEAERLINRSYNPALSSEKNVARLEDTIKELENMARAKDDSAKHYEEYGTLSNFKPRSLTTSSEQPKAAEGKYGQEVERNGKRYRWNPSVGKYQLIK